MLQNLLFGGILRESDNLVSKVVHDKIVAINYNYNDLKHYQICFLYFNFFTFLSFTSTYNDGVMMN